MYFFHMHILRTSTERTLNLCEKKIFYSSGLCENDYVLSRQKYVSFHDVTTLSKHELFFTVRHDLNETQISFSYTRDHRLLLYCTLAILL